MLIACLNFFNEAEALKETVPSYYDHVDKIIAVDGAYKGYPVARPYSTDGSLEYLRSLKKVELVTTREFWPDQCVKRTEYFKRGKPGDVFFVIDADEILVESRGLKELPVFDVAWVTVKSPIYRGPYKEPRLFLYEEGLHYEGRHHWVFDKNGDLVASHQETGVGKVSVSLPVVIDHKRNLYKSAARMQQKKRFRALQNEREGIVQFVKRQPLKIAFIASFDPAGVAWHLHRAIEDTTLHSSTYFRGEDTYIGYPMQHAISEKDLLRKAIAEADIVHAHLNAHFLASYGKPRKDAVKVVHHHGSMYRRRVAHHNVVDAKFGTIRLASNFELTQYAPNLIYLPNPIPFAAYKAIAEGRERGKVFRVAHSPTSRGLKGTDAFLKAVANLKAKGLPVEAVLIERKPHKEALAMKAACDATFDSLWLGMQVSGLEAAAMGQPVIAGDELVAEKYREWLGEVPYTFASEATLEDVIERLVVDEEFYRAEARRVGRYVLAHHDLSAVAKRYLEILEEGPKMPARIISGEIKVKERIIDPRSGRVVYGRNAVIPVAKAVALGMLAGTPKEEVAPVSEKWFICPRRVIENGRILYGKGRRIPYTEAVRRGLVKPAPAEAPVIGPSENKVIAPSENKDEAVYCAGVKKNGEKCKARVKNPGDKCPVHAKESMPFVREGEERPADVSIDDMKKEAAK